METRCEKREISMNASLVIFYLIGAFAVIVGSVLTYVTSRRLGWKIPLWLLYALMGLSAYIFFAQYLKYQNLHFFTDFSHWLQILRNITIKGWPEILSHEFIIPGTLNYFSVHFIPLIYLFAIPFKLIPRPETLMVFNALAMLSAAIPLYKLALLHYVPPLKIRGGEEGLWKDGRKMSGFFVVVLLLWYPTFQYITLYEFEMLRFSIPLLLWMLYFFETRRMVPYLIFVILAILVREEVGLTVAMFGVYAWVFAKRRKEGLSALTLGLVGFVLITSVVMPAFSSAEQFKHVAAGSFAQFGTSPLEIVSSVIRHPIAALTVILDPTKLANIFMLGLPVLFVPLLAPLVLIGAAANIGIGLLSEGTIHTSYMLYYIAPSVPFIFYALLKAWPRFVSLSLWERVGLPAQAGVRGEGAFMNALLAAVLVSNIFFGPSPISLQFWLKNIQPAPFRTQDFHWSVYRVTDHHRAANKFVEMIPEDAIVSAQEFLQPRLFKKRGAMPFPQIVSKDGQYQADYVFVDRTNNGLRSESPAHMSKEEIDAVVANEVWERVAEEDGYELYRNVYESTNGVANTTNLD